MPRQLNAYLSFDGNCAEAMRRYADILGARLDALLTFGDAPGCEGMPPADAGRIMHAYLVHDDFSLMAGDTPPGVPYVGVQGVMLTLTVDTVDEAERIFAALAAGGEARMPMAETFWATRFGMVVDRFGVPWGVNGAPKPMAASA